jgi:hypothetical protein
MDDKAAYLKLRRKMRKLLEHINANLPADQAYGACHIDGECTMTTQAGCAGHWQKGVSCGTPTPITDYVFASRELVKRMKNLLAEVHTIRCEAPVQSCSFEVGGKKYRLHTTLEECEVLGGAWAKKRHTRPSKVTASSPARP